MKLPNVSFNTKLQSSSSITCKVYNNVNGKEQVQMIVL